MSIIYVPCGTCGNRFQASTTREELKEHIGKCGPPKLEPSLFVPVRGECGRSPLKRSKFYTFVLLYTIMVLGLRVDRSVFDGGAPLRSAQIAPSEQFEAGGQLKREIGYFQVP